MRTTFIMENGESATVPKDYPDISGQLESESEQDVKYPKRLRHNGKGGVLATIYKRPDCYRFYWRTRADGKPRSQSQNFSAYSEAQRSGDKVVTDLVWTPAVAASGFHPLLPKKGSRK